MGLCRKQIHYRGNGAYTSYSVSNSTSFDYTHPDLQIFTLGNTKKLSANAGSNAAICSGSSTVLSASVTNGTSPFSYSWSPSTGLSSASVYNPTATPPSTTKYVVTVTDDKGCVATEGVGVTVKPLPVVTVKSTGLVTACNNDYEATLTSSEGSSYLWSTSATTRSIAVTTEDDYSVTVTDANGCVNTSGTISTLK
ncbi:MAG: hypothetical protein K1X82_02280 [Bacteroidia bacterium]|nr:hypothetical protein [Bacteroidia bacterium]